MPACQERVMAVLSSSPAPRAVSLTGSITKKM